MKRTRMPDRAASMKRSGFAGTPPTPLERRDTPGLRSSGLTRHGPPKARLRANQGVRDPELRFSRAVRRGKPSSHRPDLGPCLLYIGADNGHGYRQFRYGGRNGYAHRYAWERINGAIPDGMTVDHLCRVRNCVEITHLELVDGVTNYRRGRAVVTACRNGHPYVSGSFVLAGASGLVRNCLICRKDCSRRSAARRTCAARGVEKRTIKYDQAVVAEQIYLVRFCQLRIAEAARVIGCNPNYLGRRIWQETKKAVVARDGGACARCGSTARLDVNHRIPRGMGGSSRPEISFGMANLITLCRSCHSHIEQAARHEGYENGWLLRHGSTLADEPVLIGARRVLLTDLGTYQDYREARHG